MTGIRMLHCLRLAAVTAALMLPLGSVAWGDDDDNYYRHHEAREHGYRNGYHDGLREGRYDTTRGYRFNFKSQEWEDARGYERWMGSRGDYKRAYRRGYEEGYRRSYGDWHGRYRDRDDRYRDNRDWRDRDWR